MRPVKQSLGWTLTLAGIGVCLFGMWRALSPVIHLYQDAMADPLKDSATEDGKALARQMVPGLVIAAVGVPLLLAGSVLLKVSLVQRLVAKGKAGQGHGR